jgi:hypothetical protein
MKIIGVFQEYDCPNGIDFDLNGQEILCLGETVRCSFCGEMHAAGADGPTQTAVQ